MDISVITVTWNSKNLIGEQIRSVEAAGRGLSLEQIIVDNGSPDGTADFIKTKFPHVKLITNSENSGFAAANNQALRFAKGRFLLFLNPDMRLLPDSLAVMISWMNDHPRAGIASPKLLDENGKPNTDARPRRFPGLFDQLIILFKINHIFPQLLKKYLLSDFDPNKEQRVDSVRGSFMFMRREIADALGWAFDPRYFFWFEDVDICRETKRLGYEVWYTPVISAVDYVGQSFRQQPSLWKQRQFTKSMVTYFKKWEPWYIWMWIAAARPAGILLVGLASWTLKFFPHNGDKKIGL